MSAYAWALSCWCVLCGLLLVLLNALGQRRSARCWEELKRVLDGSAVAFKVASRASGHLPGRAPGLSVLLCLCMGVFFACLASALLGAAGFFPAALGALVVPGAAAAGSVLKLRVLGEPLVWTDFMLVREALTQPSLYFSYASARGVTALAAFAGLLLVLAALGQYCLPLQASISEILSSVLLALVAVLPLVLPFTPLVSAQALKTRFAASGLCLSHFAAADASRLGPLLSLYLQLLELKAFSKELKAKFEELRVRALSSSSAVTPHEGDALDVEMHSGCGVRELKILVQAESWCSLARLQLENAAQQSLRRAGVELPGSNESGKWGGPSDAPALREPVMTTLHEPAGKVQHERDPELLAIAAAAAEKGKPEGAPAASGAATGKVTAARNQKAAAIADASARTATDSSVQVKAEAAADLKAKVKSALDAAAGSAGSTIPGTGAVGVHERSVAFKASSSSPDAAGYSREGRRSGAAGVANTPDTFGAAHGLLNIAWNGAYTMRTEFEVLSGEECLSLGPYAYDPYLAVARQPFPSLARVFKARGFICVCVHPNSGHFFSRDKVMRNLGFDALVALPDPGLERLEHCGPHVSDEALLKYLVKLAECRELEGFGGRRLNLAAAHGLFFFVITMEAHGPWLKGRIKEYPALDPLGCFALHVAHLKAGIEALRQQGDKLQMCTQARTPTAGAAPDEGGKSSGSRGLQRSAAVKQAAASLEAFGAVSVAPLRGISAASPSGLLDATEDANARQVRLQTRTPAVLENTFVAAASAATVLAGTALTGNDSVCSAALPRSSAGTGVSAPAAKCGSEEECLPWLIVYGDHLPALEQIQAQAGKLGCIAPDCLIFARTKPEGGFSAARGADRAYGEVGADRLKGAVEGGSTKRTGKTGGIDGIDMPSMSGRADGENLVVRPERAVNPGSDGADGAMRCGNGGIEASFGMQNASLLAPWELGKLFCTPAYDPGNRGK